MKASYTVATWVHFKLPSRMHIVLPAANAWTIWICWWFCSTFPRIITLKELVTPASEGPHTQNKARIIKMLKICKMLPTYLYLATIQKQDISSHVIHKLQFKKKWTSTEMTTTHAMVAECCKKSLHGNMCSEYNTQIKSLAVTKFQIPSFWFFRLGQNNCDTGFKIDKSICWLI